MLKATYTSLNLQFIFPAGTSRGVLLEKPSSFLILVEEGVVGIGECSTISGLSIDSEETYFKRLGKLCSELNAGTNPSDIDLSAYPSIAFGLETALLDLKAKGSKQLFDTDFSRGRTGIPINGLVWMGERAFMEKQIREKIEAGYRCIKLKVGAIDFETELQILGDIRKQFSPSEIEIRLDANGAFNPSEALEKLNKLSAYHIHSIEQPVKQCGVWSVECENSPIPIALDEELIGVIENKEELLKKIKPQYIILKPSMLGGFKVSEEWISLAKKHNIGWWITSALEANIGLNAIAQWTATLGSTMPQGLGTGQLYHNNIPSPLVIEKAELFYKEENSWDLKILF